MKKYGIVTITICILLLFGIVMSILYKEPVVGTGLNFVCFVIFCVLIPGASLKCMLRIKTETDIEFLSYSLFLGYLLTFLEYFILVPFGIQKYATIVVYFISFLFFLYLLFYRRTDRFLYEVADNSGCKITIIFILVLLLLEIFTYAGANIIPVDIESNVMHRSSLVWIRNVVYLCKHFPLDYNYHYFSSCQLALVSLVTGMRPVILGFGFEFIVPIMMMVLGGYLVFKELSKEKYCIVGGLLALFFTSGLTDYSIIKYMSRIFVGPFANDYGLGIFLFTFYMMIRLYKTQKMQLKETLVIVLMFSLLCGVKAPYGAIALVGIGITCWVWMINKDIKRAVVLGVPVLVSFLLVYYLVTNVRGYSTGYSMLGTPVIYQYEEGSTEIDFVYNILSSWPIPQIISTGLFVLIYTWVCHPLVFSVVGYQIVSAIIKRRKLRRGSAALICMIVAGVVVTASIGMIGSSQMYFMMAVYPVGIAFALYNGLYRRGNSIRGWRIKSVILILLFCLSFAGWGFYANKNQVSKYVKKGLCNYRGVETDNNRNERGFVSLKQNEVFEWIRSNIDDSELLVTNIDHVVIGALSEKTIFLNDNVEVLCDSNTLESQDLVIDLLRCEGADYFVFDKKDKSTEDFIMKSTKASIVYTNEEVDIYSLNN